MARNLAWGIDIGESAIKAVQLRRSGETVTIVEQGTVPCESPADEAQASDREFRVRSALMALQEEMNLKKGELMVAISGQDVFPRFIPLPPVEKKRIPEIVRYEARTQMPFPIDEVIWDYQPLTEDPEPGEEVEVALFAIKRASVYSFLANLRLAHIVPQVVQIAPLALYNFLTYDQAIDAGTVAIDVGAGNTDLVILDGERFWTRNISISGNDITRALQEKYQISFEEAEQLKRQASSSGQGDRLFGAMRPILDDLLGEVQRSIGYYKAQTRNVRIEDVLLLGNAFKLGRLVDYFSESLDYNVSVLDGLRRIQVGPGMDRGAFEAELPNYGVALGLALQGLDLARVRIDMMPPDLKRAILLRKKIPYAAAAVALLALPVFLGFRSVNRAEAHVGEEAPKVQRIIDHWVKQKGDEDKAKKLDPMSTQLEQIAKIGRGRRDWLKYIDNLSMALNDINRDRFLLRRVAHIADEPADRRRRSTTTKRSKRGTDDKDKTPKTKGGVKVLVEFESPRAFEPGDAASIEKSLQKQPYVRAIVFDSFDTDTKGAGRAKATDQGVVVQDTGAEVHVATVHVTFSVEPLVEEKAEPDDLKSRTSSKSKKKK